MEFNLRNVSVGIQQKVIIIFIYENQVQVQVSNE